MSSQHLNTTRKYNPKRPNHYYVYKLNFINGISKRPFLVFRFASAMQICSIRRLAIKICHINSTVTYLFFSETEFIISETLLSFIFVIKYYIIFQSSVRGALEQGKCLIRQEDG